MPDAGYLPHTNLSRRIDSVIGGLGRATAYIWVILLVVIVVNVMLRYAFSQGRIELEELQWHLYSAGFLLGLSYAYQADAHIRVDVVHERLSPRAQAWIELYGILLFLLPFIALILIYSVPFVAASFELNEISPSPGGLPLRWVIKAFLPLGFALLLLAAVSRLVRVWHFLFLPADSGGHGAG
jgi:TRAP-type mannitol/chloroaromatic compound transport system permease small subunit